MNFCRSFFSFSSINRTRNLMENIRFDNLALRVLPIDPIEENYVRTVSAACFSRVKPTPVKNPRIVAYSADALKLIDVTEDAIKVRSMKIWMKMKNLLFRMKNNSLMFSAAMFFCPEWIPLLIVRRRTEFIEESLRLGLFSCHRLLRTSIRIFQRPVGRWFVEKHLSFSLSFYLKSVRSFRCDNVSRTTKRFRNTFSLQVFGRSDQQK